MTEVETRCCADAIGRTKLASCACQRAYQPCGDDDLPDGEITTVNYIQVGTIRCHIGWIVETRDSPSTIDRFSRRPGQSSYLRRSNNHLPDVVVLTINDIQVAASQDQ